LPPRGAAVAGAVEVSVMNGADGVAAPPSAQVRSQS
jgi:hypothetical protein